MTTLAQRTARPIEPDLEQRIRETNEVIAILRSNHKKAIRKLQEFRNELIRQRASMHPPLRLPPAAQGRPTDSPLPAYSDMADSQITADGDGHCDRAGHEQEAAGFDDSQINLREQV